MSIGIRSAIMCSLVALTLFGCSDDRFFTENFTSTKGVASVEKYFNYEDHRFADLIIQENGRLEIMDFNKDIFSSTRLIFLKRISNVVVKCTDEKGIRNIINGFNLVDFINDYTELGQVKNIGEIVSIYDDLNVRISSLATGSFVKYKFQFPNLEIEKKHVWCKFVSV